LGNVIAAIAETYAWFAQGRTEDVMARRAKQAATAATALSYRKKACEMLEKAEAASGEHERGVYIALANHWLRLAQALEDPKR
jgi:hypothetical protein